MSQEAKLYPSLPKAPAASAHTLINQNCGCLFKPTYSAILTLLSKLDILLSLAAAIRL